MILWEAIPLNVQLLIQICLAEAEEKSSPETIIVCLQVSINSHGHSCKRACNELDLNLTFLWILSSSSISFM